MGALREYFQLEKYYCPIHGTKLEALLLDDDDDELKQDEEADEQEAQDKDKNGQDEETHSYLQQEEGEEVTNASLKCKDCVETKIGNERCPQCEEFSAAEDIGHCAKCSKTGREKCEEDLCHSCCETCDNHYCGENECPPVLFCEGCECSYCLNCKPHSFCEDCHDDLGCIDCAVAHSYMCGSCDKVFCYDCRNWFFCDCCYSCICNQCEKSFYCEFCNKTYCSSCGERPKSCENCGKQDLCPKHAFKCSECETVTCPSCTKTYKCQECDKDICADCKDVFKRCCCEKKRKFVSWKAAVIG